jgi:Tol biopolymer transport system component
VWCTRYTLYLVARDGSGLRLIADSLTSPPSPSWSPHGHRLVYRGERSIYVLDVQHKRTRAIAPEGFQAVWAPRGNRIAYTANRDGYGVACFVNADGSRRRCTRGHSLTSLIWSPDARRVAFRQANPRRIGIVDSNARHVRYLGDLGQHARPAAWSPDGRRLAYWFGFPSWFGGLSVLRLASPTRSVRVVDKPETFLSDIRWRATGITYVAKRPVPEPQRVRTQVAAPRRAQN